MTDRVLPCPNCEGGCWEENNCDRCALCNGTGTIPDRRRATPNEDALRAEVAELTSELGEQARLLGISGSVEAKLLAKVDGLKLEVAIEQVACDEFMNINEGLNKRITLLLERIDEHKQTICDQGECIAELRAFRGTPMGEKP